MPKFFNWFSPKWGIPLLGFNAIIAGQKFRDALSTIRREKLSSPKKDVSKEAEDLLAQTRKEP